MLKINCDYKIKSDIEFILESEHINILDLSIRTKISRATLDDIMSNKVVRNEIYEKLYSYIYKSNYRLNKTKEEILKEKTHKILFHGSKYGLDSVSISGSRNNCDFGNGFYLGENYSQALAFVCEKDNSCVYSFQYDLDNLKIKKFECNLEWMLAICYFRGSLKEYSSNIKIQNIISEVEKADVIIAPIADNKMFYIMSQFTDGDINLEVELSPELETVWLTQKQMEELFDVKHATVSEHISNILSSGELDGTSVGFSDKSTGGRKPKIYNLDMILSVGYRVNSKRGIAFRRWANSVLKQYVIQGYAINEKRLQALERTVDIQTKMLASTLEVEESDILKAVTSYTDALMLLDQYDHQSLKKPVGNRPIYKITYEECKKMVSHMEDSFKSDVFGVEKENGKVEGILAAVYQSVFGGDVYPSLEEKAANLLYFMIKDHPYADGCKRIAASLFLEFLARNNALYRDDNKIISDGALVAITLMIAESRPEEKDIMVNLVMNFLTM